MNSPAAPPSAIELSVIVPCLNEELNLPELTRRVLRVFEVGGFAGELVLVDDGSTDGSAGVMRALMAEHGPLVNAVFHPENRGIAAGWKSGALAARGTLIAILDADLQYQPEDLLRLRRELYEHSVDIVQGWRSATGRRKDRRFHLSRGLNTLLNGVFSMELQDNKSGFVICAKEVFLDLLSYEGRYAYWQSFIMVAAHAKGYSYKQVETIFEQRRQGTSFLEGMGAFRASARSLIDIAEAVVEYRARPPRSFAESQFLRRHPVPSRAAPRSAAEELRWRAYMASFNETHWMITRNVEEYHEALQKTQWLDAARTAELQDEKLRRLVRHAYRNVPYYRAKMQAAGLRPEDVRGQADLPKLPLLSKGDVRAHLYFDIMSENHDKADILRVTTSGVTGEPFVCYADRAQLEMRWAASLRAREWTGYRFGEPALRLFREAQGQSRSQALRERADAALSRRSAIPVSAMNEKNLATMAETLREARPALMEGHAESLDFLARWLLSRGIRGARGEGPRAILSSGQTLSAESRSRIEEAFGCEVFDRYGSREFSGIACECEAHAGHHVVAESYIVELLREGRPALPGEMGEVVITDLNNYCMPFIRYRIGDMAMAMDGGACACGRGAPRLGAIEGRAPSIFQGTEGRYLPGTFFAHCLKDYDHAIKRFQIVQEERSALIVRVVKGGRFSDDALAELLATFRRTLGERMRIEVAFVDEVTMESEGARRACVSRLDLGFPPR